MHKALLPREDIRKQHVSRKGEKWFARIEDSVEKSIRQLEDYIKKSKETLITATRNNTNNTRVNGAIINRKNSKKSNCMDSSSNKQVKSHTRRLGHKIKKENRLRETDFAAQNNAIRTNYVKAKIDKTQQNSKCRLCSDRDEMINHIMSECNKLAQKEYKTRHDWVETKIHRELRKKFKFDYSNKEFVLKNETQKVLWNFKIKTSPNLG